MTGSDQRALFGGDTRSIGGRQFGLARGFVNVRWIDGIRKHANLPQKVTPSGGSRG